MWFYFPAVLSIKASAGLLIAVVAACVLRRREVTNVAMTAAALILLCSPAFRVQTGIRMVLPIVALTIVGVSVALATATTFRDRRITALATMVLIAWSAIGAWRSWPDGLRSANELWGGTANAYRFVSDSNYDWGQGLPELAAHVGDSPPVQVWSWGTDPAARSARWSLLDPRAIADADEASLRYRLEGRVLAVSTTALFGSVLAEGTRVSEADRHASMVAESLRRLLKATPWQSRTRTFLIYDFRPDRDAGAPSPPPH